MATKKKVARRAAPKVKVVPAPCLLDERGRIVAVSCWTVMGRDLEAGKFVFQTQAAATLFRNKHLRKADFVVEHWEPVDPIKVFRWSR